MHINVLTSITMNNALKNKDNYLQIRLERERILFLIEWDGDKWQCAKKINLYGDRGEPSYGDTAEAALSAWMEKHVKPDCPHETWLPRQQAYQYAARI